MEREDVAHRPVDRRRDPRRLPEFNDCTTEPINFQPVTALKVIVHRGGHLRREAVAECETILGVVGGESDTLRTTNGNRLAHNVQK